MEQLHRRNLLLKGGAAAGIALLHGRALAQTGPTSEGLIPWISQCPPLPQGSSGP